MERNADGLSKLSSDIDNDRAKIVRFFKEMLKINAVNPRMGADF